MPYRGSTWKIWDFHLHTPCSVLRNDFGDQNKEETWDKYVNMIEKKTEEKNIAAVGITDYFTIEGYKKILKYKDRGRLNNIFIFPNIEFRIDTIINITKGEKRDVKRLNQHVIFSPDVSIHDIEENFLHDLEFIYEEDTFNSGEKRKLKIHNLAEFGQKIKSDHPKFRKQSDLYVGCINAVVDPIQIKNVLEERRDFKGKYFIILAEDNLSDLDWDQSYGTRKHLTQRSHCIFSSNKKSRDFYLGKTHDTINNYLYEFKSLKPCIWGCDSHSFNERFLEPDTDQNDKINYCWIKSEATWEGLKQILYEPEERVRIQENCPESQKSIYTIDKIKIDETKINPNLIIRDTEINLNRNLVSIIGGRGSGKTAILDMIASCFKEGDKSKEIENSFYHRLYGAGLKKSNAGVPIKLNTISGHEFEKTFGRDDSVFELSDIVYITQNHFEEFSSDSKRLNTHVFKLIFEKFPEDKEKCIEYKRIILSKNDRIQENNLKIQQLKNEIEKKTGLEDLLKQKEGEIEDYDKRIYEIESNNEANKEVSELSNKLGGLRNEKQMIDSNLNESERILADISIARNFALRLSDFNRSLKENLSRYQSDFNLYPDNEITRLIDVSEEILSKNKLILNRLLDETEKSIAEIRDRLKEFEDTNKIISDLSQKRSYSYDEMSKTKKKLEELNKKEQMIKDIEIERFNNYKDIITTFREWKRFVERIIAKFEVGKDTILDQLSFGVSVNLADKEYLTNINELINNKSISEEMVHKSLDDSILHRLYHMANHDEIPDFNDLSKHMDYLSKDFFEKKRKNATYSVFYDRFYKNIMEMKIKLRAATPP